ncbi:MAG: trypsin-like peptidase domain-containing protein [Nitrospiraceae bacterium]
MRKSVMLPVLALLLCIPLLGQERVHSVSERVSPAIVQIETEEGIGAGFIVRDDGTIVTALGVIDRAAQVTVTGESGRVFDNVSLLVKDERRGIAIIRVPGFGLPTVKLGDSDNLAEQQILMIGRPLAAEGRSLTNQPGRVLGVNYSDRGHKIITIEEPIPNDALGGPIVDAEGRAIAVVVFQEDRNLAIPINDVRGLLDYVEHTQPIRQWASEPASESPWHRFLLFWSGLLATIWSFYPWLIAALVAGFVIYCLISLRYSLLASRAAKEPRLAPISVSGKRSAEFSVREAAIVLDSHISRLNKTTAQQQRDIHEKAIALLSRVDLPGENIRMLLNARVDVQLHPLRLSELRLPEVAEIGGFRIPIGLMARLVKKLFGWIPMPSRDRYRKNLIHVSLMTVGSDAHLVVERDGQYLASSARIDSAGSDTEADQTTGFTKTGEVDLLRESVFMILELTQDERLPGRNWLGKKHFVDGLEQLDQSLLTGNDKSMNQAINSIFHAAEVDEANHEAVYIKGHILVARREENSNALAEVLLTRALDTKKSRLKALTHAGLVNCYAQQRFRLAKRKAEVLEKAQAHVGKAYECWREVTQERSHPWILAADAFVRVLTAMNLEETNGDKDETTQLYRGAAKLYYEALKLDENNSAYSNALGFSLLKLVEQPELDIPIPPEKFNVPQKSEHYFQKSLVLDPSNKLTHANLCLLYATEWYRNKDKEKYLDECRRHGSDAVKLDPKYVHGYRDLGLSLLKYREIEEACSYLKKAMHLASDSEKKREIESEVKTVLNQERISKENWCD